MIFWRKKKNIEDQEAEAGDDRLLHPENEPELEPGTDTEVEMPHDVKERIAKEGEAESLDDNVRVTPTPAHNKLDDVRDAEQEQEDAAENGGWLGRLQSGLRKSSNKLTKGIGDILTKRTLDQEMLDELEELLISADLGPKTAAKIIESFKAERFGKEVTDVQVKEALAASIARILTPVARPLDESLAKDGEPFTMLVCGVNGVGKTTTIGKIAHEEHVVKHRPVVMAAGDTYRAAAIEQLEIWAQRAHCPLVKKEIGADAAAVAYEAHEKAVSDKAALLLIDSAGRLHNKANLMAELEKMIRVLKKRNEALPHAVLLVLDATTGQNAFEQVRTFKEIVNISGLAITKLDGSARGGVVVGLADEFGLPIHYVGVGEKAGDLQPFHPEQFARSLVGLPPKDETDGDREEEAA